MTGLKTTLYLIRHGETPRMGYCNGHLDVELTTGGIAEIESLGKRLQGEGLQALYASDLKRSVNGARILGRAMHLEPTILPGLREKCFGAWQGLSEEEIQRRFPSEWKEWITNPADAKPTGGESFREVSQRVLPALYEIIKRHPGEKVAVVGHGGTNRIILCHALNLELRHMERIEQRHAALNLIDFYEEGALVLLMNG